MTRRCGARMLGGDSPRRSVPRSRRWRGATPRRSAGAARAARRWPRDADVAAAVPRASRAPPRRRGGARGSRTSLAALALLVRRHARRLARGALHRAALARAQERGDQAREPTATPGRARRWARRSASASPIASPGARRRRARARAAGARRRPTRSTRPRCRPVALATPRLRLSATVPVARADLPGARRRRSSRRRSARRDGVERLRVDGAPAYWITGAHGFAYRGRTDNVDYEHQRLAGHTLLVERDGVLLRIEGAIAQQRDRAARDRATQFSDGIRRHRRQQRVAVALAAQHRRPQVARDRR